MVQPLNQKKGNALDTFGFDLSNIFMYLDSLGA